MAEMVFTTDEIVRAAANGVNYLNLYNRVNNLYWNKEAAITEPITKRNTTWAENKETAETNGVSRYMFTRAIKEGYSVEEAVMPIVRSCARPRVISEELAALGEANGFTYQQIRDRKRRFHFSDERAVSQPIGKRIGKGDILTEKEYSIAAKNGISREMADRRVRYLNWSNQKAITKMPWKRCLSKEEYVIAESNGISRKTAYNRKHFLKWDTVECITKTPWQGRLSKEEYTLLKSNGISRKTAYARSYRLKWDIEDCVTKPVRKYTKQTN